MQTRCLIALTALLLTGLPTRAAEPVFHVIAYHDVRDEVHDLVDADQYAISTRHLIDQFNWIRLNGFVPVSIDDIVAAKEGKRELPDKALLLTFDDGLESVYTHVFPLLKLFNYPAVVSLVTGWTNGDAPPPPPDASEITYSFMTWEQVQEMHASGLVEIASHSNDLHRGILGNPQGNTQPAAVTRAYENGRYETENEYLTRIRADLQRSADLIEAHIGQRPRVMTWPYGRFNQPSLDIAADLGMPITLTLTDKSNVLSDMPALGRHLVSANPQVDVLGIQLLHRPDEEIVRAAQVDLDYIYDPDEKRQEANLGLLLDRIKALQISHVFLQAFADPDADGGAQELYFPNRHLPVRADLFNRVAWQLSTRSGVRVFAWLPVLSYAEGSVDSSMRVTQLKDGATSFDDASEPRLSVFDRRARKLIREIYEDLAVYAAIDGVLFHDDARLNEFEDANPSALEAYRKEFGADFAIDAAHHSPELNRRWARFKTRALIEFTQSLIDTVQRYRPSIKTARNLFAPALLDDNAEIYLAQDYELFAETYDYVALMAMPYFENAAKPSKFFLDLIEGVRAYDRGLQKTIFELQTIDWRDQRPLPVEELRDTMRWLQSQGVKHIGYYPDDFIRGAPSLKDLKTGISLAVYPLEAPR